MHFHMNCLISESRRCRLNTGICISLYATWKWLDIILRTNFDQTTRRLFVSYCLLITVCLDQRCLELHCIWDMDHREPESVPHWSDDLRHSLLGLYAIMQNNIMFRRRYEYNVKYNSSNKFVFELPTCNF